MLAQLTAQLVQLLLQQVVSCPEMFSLLCDISAVLF
jgi:hypothetical protein